MYVHWDKRIVIVMENLQNSIHLFLGQGLCME